MVNPGKPYVPSQQALLDAQWSLVDALESLPDDVAAGALERRLQAQAAHARRTLTVLDQWSTIPERVHGISTATANHVRARRVLDFVLPEERIVDIGTNYGYLSSLLLRERRPKHYAGFDLAQHQLDSVKAAISELGLPAPSVELAIANLYDLTDEVERNNPDLVLLTEVLEHVPDAEGALTKLANVTPSGAAILFTVPLFGRHDACWGHWSVFDAERVQTMCASSSLSILHVEPVYNAWLFVLASRSSAGHDARLSQARTAGWPVASIPKVTQHQLRRIPPSACTASSRWNRGLEHGATLTATPSGARISGRSSDEKGTTYLGLRIAVPPFEFLRAELRISPDSAASIFVDAVNGEGNRVSRWRWRRGEGAPISADSFTVVLREGERSGRLLCVEPGPLDAVARLEVFVEVQPGADAEVEIVRCAVLPVGDVAD